MEKRHLTAASRPQEGWMSSEAASNSAGRDESTVEAIQSVDLPEPVLAVVDAYESAGGERDRFLWHWIYDLLPAFTLSSVPTTHDREVRILKTKLTVLVTLLDDIAETDGDVQTFEAIRRIVRGRGGVDGTAGIDPQAVAFAAELWADIEASLRAAPRQEEFRPIFDYDLDQTMNAMEYARVVNENPTIATLPGARRYGSHNMVVFPYTDVDFMYSPSFDRADFGPTREVLWDLQTMARIGNWLTTWKREVHEGDISSGIVVYALKHGIVSPAELDQSDPEVSEAVVERIERHRVPAMFEAEWRDLHRHVSQQDYATASVDLDALVAGMETVMSHHLAGEGHK